jgi:hypothetical protein
MMTSAAFILGRRKPSDDGDDGPVDSKVSVPSQTLTLFGLGVLTLGVDAYLYGMITGTAPPIDSHRNVLPEAQYACAVAWTQYMPASSMLAVGASFMIVGPGWMLAWHIGFHDVRSKAVAYVPGATTGIVVITTSLMMVRNATLYATIMNDDFSQPISPILIRTLWILLTLLILWIVIAVGLRTLGLLIRVADSSRELPDVLALRSGSLALATLSATLLAIAGRAFASIATDTYLLRDSTTGMPTPVGVITGIIIGVLPQYVILVPLALSVPGPTVKASWREIEQWRTRRARARVHPVVRPPASVRTRLPLFAGDQPAHRRRKHPLISRPGQPQQQIRDLSVRSQQHSGLVLADRATPLATCAINSASAGTRSPPSADVSCRKRGDLG